jgi:hypothetical protein
MVPDLVGHDIGGREVAAAPSWRSSVVKKSVSR